MPNILVNNNFYQGTSSACITDLTPPTFSGITSLDVESRGQIRAGWSAASDATTPIRYEVYIKASTSSGLFNTTNIVAVTPNLQYDIFTLPDSSFLVNGTTYYVGIRAIDGVSNRDSNTVSMSVISTGVLTAIDVYQTHASWSVDETNQLRITLWGDKNESLAKSPGAVMGTASYQVYDRAGSAVVGLSESGLSINSDGLYVATPVANTTSEVLKHYTIKVSISIDGEVRTNFIRMQSGVTQYEIQSAISVNSDAELTGSFWISENETILTSNLGVGSFTLYDSQGNAVSGLSQSGISANGNGVYILTPISLPAGFDESQSYFAKVTIVARGVTRSQNVPFSGHPVEYTNRAIFSINAINQLEATFWCTANGVLCDPAILGTASYQVYDKDGNAVVGLSETGITADSNGYYQITAVSAAPLSDLTHYVAKITVEIAGIQRESTRGFTLLGN